MENKDKALEIFKNAIESDNNTIFITNDGNRDNLIINSSGLDTFNLIGTILERVLDIYKLSDSDIKEFNSDLSQLIIKYANKQIETSKVSGEQRD